MFAFWLNTKFIEGNYMCLEKSVLDKACKDKKNKLFPAGFKVELFLDRIDEIDNTKLKPCTFTIIVPSLLLLPFSSPITLLL